MTIHGFSILIDFFMLYQLFAIYRKTEATKTATKKAIKDFTDKQVIFMEKNKETMIGIVEEAFDEIYKKKSK